MKLTKAYNMYGASLGRRDNTTEKMHPIKLYLRRVPLDAGGYDGGGAYWGLGLPLFRAWGDGAEELQEVFMRAQNRNEAKNIVFAIFPKARFYR